MKIWSTSKLESVLDRCLAPNTGSAPAPSAPQPPTALHRPLTRLLESERIHGTTERDPTQKRHDFRYFTKGSYFVLLEDMRGELATIAACEYSSKGDPTWPVLHCHPHGRGPFVAFDERDQRRLERMQAREKENLKAEAQGRPKQTNTRKQRIESHVGRGGDLRRSLSMSHLHRRGGNEAPVGAADGGAAASANASGFLASGAAPGYTAASGNSVAITSTTGTTSTAGLRGRSFQQLSAPLRGLIENHVVTSRRVSSLSAGGKQKTGTMGPPSAIPDRANAPLRKSRSTNTLKLPKREEGSKPGYCECCRVKFKDFEEVGVCRKDWGSWSDVGMQHSQSHRHRKFATTEANFLQLDVVLARVQRRPIGWSMPQVSAETFYLKFSKDSRTPLGPHRGFGHDPTVRGGYVDLDAV
jgi:regulatory subunit for Cdc7p protein kinase